MNCSTLTIDNFSIRNLNYYVDEDRIMLIYWLMDEQNTIIKAPLGGCFELSQGFTRWTVDYSKNRREELFHQLAGSTPLALIEECERFNTKSNWVYIPLPEEDAYDWFVIDGNQIFLGPDERDGIKGWNSYFKDNPPCRNAHKEYRTAFSKDVIKTLRNEAVEYLTQYGTFT